VRLVVWGEGDRIKCRGFTIECGGDMMVEMIEMMILRCAPA
jgi:hypothetical protein